MYYIYILCFIILYIWDYTKFLPYCQWKGQRAALQLSISCWSDGNSADSPESQKEPLGHATR